MAIKCVSSLGDFVNSFAGDEYTNIQDAWKLYANGGNLYGPEEEVKEVKNAPEKKYAKDFIDWLQDWYSNRKEQVYNAYHAHSPIMSRVQSLLNGNYKYQDLYNKVEELRGIPIYDRIVKHDGTPNTYRHLAGLKRENNTLDNIQRTYRNHGGGGTKGSYDTYTDAVYLNWKDSGLRKWEVIPHELTHGLTERTRMYDNVWEGFSPGEVLNYGYSPDGYYDNPDEIYSRLMHFRYQNKLDPTEKYNWDNIIENHSDWIDDGLFERYNKEFILHLLNDVAYNDTNKEDVNYAAQGGPIKKNNLSDQEYYTKLEKVAEQNAHDWRLSPDEAYLQVLNDNSYDYRGYYNKYPNGKGNALNHWTDEFKTVYHPTFSDESIYSGKISKFNPYGLHGGHWEKDLYMKAPWMSNYRGNGGPLSFYSPSGALKPVTTLEKFVNKYADGGNMFDGEITVPFLPTYTPSFTINSGNSLIAQATNRAIQQGVKRRNEAEADAKADKKNQAIHKGKDGSKYMTGNAGQALMFFMDKGLSEEQALGMVANLMGESELNPTAYTSAGGGQGAYGIAQWRGDRLRALRKKYGEKPTLNQQLEFVWHELNTTHKEGLKQLKASKTAHEAASAALGYYEFQGGVQSAINSFNEHGQDGRAAYMSKLNWVNRLQGKALLPKDYDNKHLLHNDIIQVGNDIDNTAHAVPAQYLYPFPEARIPSYEVNQPIVPTSSLESFVDSYNTKKYEETTPENLLEKLQLQQELEEQKTLKRNLFNYAIESTQTPTFQMQLPQQVSGQQLMNLWDNYFRF